ncbi:hypothetical protein HDU77_007704 [Chytriomyces hyalinus]|nr:hypothetical protein HDU77_007704 [Chytriomyces hyalinus]
MSFEMDPASSDSCENSNISSKNIEATFTHFPTYTDWCSREANQLSTLEQYHDELYTHGLHLSKEMKLPEDAFAVFEYLANKGHAGGMNEYGVNLVSGDIPDTCTKDGFRDMAKGFAWVEKSANLGFPKAQRNLSAYLSAGIVCEPNGVEALRWGYTAIEQGYVEAYCPIGCTYANGKAVPNDDAKAVELLQRGMDAGSIDCISRLGVLYQSGRGVAKNVPKAIELYEKANGLGDLQGSYYLGNLYADGDDGIPIDLNRAAKYYERAAEAGIVDAIRDLGDCYEYGNGVPQSYEISMRYYTQAAKFEDSWSLHYLGDSYRHGIRVQKDYAKALQYFERAALRKHGEATCSLAFMLGEGIGCKKDPVRAAKLYQQSAALGSGIGAYNAGVVFQFGSGVPANSLTAIEFYRKAASLDCDLPLQPDSNFINLLHSVGKTFLKENKRKEAIDHFQEAAQLGHAKSIVELSNMYASGFLGMYPVAFDTNTCYIIPPQTPDTTLSILPVELMTQIFQWLHPKQCIQLRSTSRRVLALIDNESFARHMLQFNAFFIPEQTGSSMHWFDKLLFHGPHAFQVAYVELRLNGMKEISSQELKYVSHRSSSGYNLMNKFPPAFIHWTSLTSLHLSGLRLAYGIPESIKYLRNLKEVDLTRNNRVHNDVEEFRSAAVERVWSDWLLGVEVCRVSANAKVLLVAQEQILFLWAETLQMG